MTVRDCDESLGDQLAAGEQLARELSRQIDSSRDVLSRLTQITIAARPAPQPAPMPVAAPIEAPPAQPDPRATAAAASAFAARARQRSAAA